MEENLHITESGLERLRSLPPWSGEPIQGDEDIERVYLLLAAAGICDTKSVDRTVKLVNDALTTMTMVALFMKGEACPAFGDDGTVEWTVRDDAYRALFPEEEE